MDADAGGMSIWSRGKFQKLLSLATDVPEVEICEPGIIHERLNEQDFEECKSRVDRWSEGTLWMVDEKKLQHRLYTRLVSPPAQQPVSASSEEAQAVIERRVLGAYDGFNTVRRCRSAREHLLCGLQDVLEHVLVPVGNTGQTLLAHVLRLDPTSLTFSHFLFDLLSLLRQSQDLFSQAHVAGHLARCVSLVISAITSPPRTRTGAPAQEVSDGSARDCLLRDLDFLLSVPARTVGTSGIALRADLYSAILKLLQYLKRQRGGVAPAQGQRAGASTPPEVEEVLARHRMDLLGVAVMDMAGRLADKLSPAERRLECESKATALAIIQMLLPKPGGVRSMVAPEVGPTMRGLLIHHSLVPHLTEDMLPGDHGSQLGELLDVTKTEDKQPLLLVFTAKMAVLLQLAQDPEGMRELANCRTIYRLARCRYLISHVQNEQHLRALIRPQDGGPHSTGILVKRFHHLLLPTLQLFVMLLHNVTEGRKIAEPALEFLWAHRYLVQEVLRVNGASGMAGVQGPGHPGASAWRGTMAEASDECVEERRLLLDAFLIIEHLGAFDRTRPQPAAEPRDLSTAGAPPLGPATNGVSSGAAVEGVRFAELDALLTSATAELMRALLEDASKSSFWQVLEASGGPQKARAHQTRGVRRAMLMLQTCEISLRLFLARARRIIASANGAAAGMQHRNGAYGSGDMQQELLVFDCSSLLAGNKGERGIGGTSGFSVQR